MLAPLLLLWPMSVGLTWVVAQDIANRPFDRALEQTVRVMAQELKPAATEGVVFALTPQAREVLQADEVDQVSYQVLGVRGEVLSGDPDLPVPPEFERPVPGTVRFRDEELHNQPVRVAYLWVHVHGARAVPADSPSAGFRQPALVQVAETLGKRSTLATEIIKGVILPQFVILPLAVVLVWFALARGIAPLSELQQRIRRRAPDDLSPIDETEAPEEVSPLVRAINDLLQRLNISIQAQKRFLADAAHQMKTPLAGLRMQAELAEREIDLGQRDPQSLKQSLQQIARSSQRAAHVVNQLLALARAENSGQLPQKQPLDLARIAKEAVQDQVQRALDKRIDLGYEGPDPAPVGEEISEVGLYGGVWMLGHPVLLSELLRNLIDNAINYTPSGGTITVRIVSDPFGQVAVMQVEDTGPGIAPGERDLVLQPFYRTLGTGVDGSGLGLAIVREIVMHHGAELVIEDAHPGQAAPGTRFTVRFALRAVASDEAAEPAPPWLHAAQ